MNDKAAGGGAEIVMRDIVKYLHDTYGEQIYISMMSQYTPLSHVEQYPELNKRVSKRSYEKYID